MGARQMLDAASTGELSAFYVVGEDPMASYPDRAQVKAALEKVEFLVVQDIFMTATAQEADVVLPATSFAEKEGTFTNAERRIQRVRQGLKSPGEAKTDQAIFTMLANRMGDQVTYTGPEAVFAEIKDTVPEYGQIEYNAIGPQGSVWGGDMLAPRHKKLVAVGGAKPVSGKMQMVTGSALYHSGTLSTRSKGPLAAMPEAYVEFGREDAVEFGINEGETVTLRGNGEELKLKAKVGSRLPKGLVFVPYHFASAGVNRLYKGESTVAVEVLK